MDFLYSFQQKQLYRMIKPNNNNLKQLQLQLLISTQLNSIQILSNFICFSNCSPFTFIFLPSSYFKHFVCFRQFVETCNGYAIQTVYTIAQIYTYNNKQCLNTFASTQCTLKQPQWLLNSSATQQCKNILKATRTSTKVMEAHARTTEINLLHYKVRIKSMDMVIKQILLRISILAMLKVLAKRNDLIIVDICDFYICYLVLCIFLSIKYVIEFFMKQAAQFNQEGVYSILLLMICCLSMFADNNFINCLMQQIGAINRRKSYGEVEPVLPRRTFTRQSGTRTLYKQLPAPTQQLKTYRRRLVFDSLPSLRTYDSIHSLSSRVQSNNYQSMKKQAFNKNNQTLVTMGSETEFKLHEKSRVSQTSQNKGQQMLSNLQNQEQGQQQNENHDIILKIDDDNNQINQNGDEEIQGYEMGEQIGELEEEMQDKNKFVPKFKSYSTSQKHHLEDVVNKYLPHSEAEARMELKYLSAKFEHVRARREDIEFVGMINEYKANKKAILKQTSRKLQTLKTLATMRRATSLPKLNKMQNDRIQQIVVPSYQQLTNPDGNPEQLKRKLLAKRLEGSMSFGRLHIPNSGQKKKDGYQAILEQELGYVEQTEKYLREKGIKINSNVLKNSLLNLRQIPLQSQVQKQYPIPQLVSNPFHPKQAAKKKKK